MLKVTEAQKVLCKNVPLYSIEESEVILAFLTEWGKIDLEILSFIKSEHEDSDNLYTSIN